MALVKLFPKTVLLAFFIFVSFVAKAQLGYNYSQYSLGVSGGFNQVYGDAETIKTTQSIQFNLTYNTTPYVNFVFEAQLGKLAGGDSLTTKSGRQFNNDFSAYIFRGQLQLGELLDYSKSPFKNAIKNFYVSAGVGFVVNHITQISRYSSKVPGYYTGGENYSNEPFLPLRIGYEFKLFNQYDEQNISIDLGFNYNHIFGDNLDGYDAGKSNDNYTQFTVGVKFGIGSVSSYGKKISY